MQLDEQSKAVLEWIGLFVAGSIGAVVLFGYFALLFSLGLAFAAWVANKMLPLDASQNSENTDKDKNEP